MARTTAWVSAVDRLAHAGRSRALGAVHRQEGLHHRDGDLVRLEGHHRAVAANDLVVGERVAGGRAGDVARLLRRRGDGARAWRGCSGLFAFGSSVGDSCWGGGAGRRHVLLTAYGCRAGHTISRVQRGYKPLDVVFVDNLNNTCERFLGWRSGSACRVITGHGSREPAIHAGLQRRFGPAKPHGCCARRRRSRARRPRSRRIAAASRLKKFSGADVLGGNIASGPAELLAQQRASRSRRPGPACGPARCARGRR